MGISAAVHKAQIYFCHLSGGLPQRILRRNWPRIPRQNPIAFCSLFIWTGNPRCGKKIDVTFWMRIAGRTAKTCISTIEMWANPRQHCAKKRSTGKTAVLTRPYWSIYPCQPGNCRKIPREITWISPDFTPDFSGTNSSPWEQAHRREYDCRIRLHGVCLLPVAMETHGLHGSCGVKTVGNLLCGSIAILFNFSLSVHRHNTKN